MTRSKIFLILSIDEVQRYFATYGFLKTPLSRRKIASLLIRGFDKDQIYNIGCDVFCGYIPFGGFHD
tara:strand:- start:330 stop:530 length:201 start_codon:yes stop_codon:yes gene_type:complete